MRRPLSAPLFTVLVALPFLAACEEDPAAPCAECSAQEIPNEGWIHVSDTTVITYEHNPPASGPHFSSWAAWGIYDEPVPRGHWVHNLEHGGVVLLYRPDAPQAAIDSVLDAYEAIPIDDACGLRRVIVTPDPELDDPVAAVVADHALEGATLEIDAVLNLVESCRCSAPEDVCSSGSYAG